MTMSWTGRRLNSITNSGTTNSYLYDANGIRTRKTVGGVTTDYFLNGSTILAEKTGSSVIWYIYDSDGEILWVHLQRNTVLLHQECSGRRI